MAQTVLSARIREGKGKGAARKLRRDNQIPAIFYGPGTEPIMLAVDYPELTSFLKQAYAENVIVDLKIQSGKGSKTYKAILRELQVDPVKDTYLHADFYEISMDKEITVDIPIHLVNVPVGVTNGGVLQQVRREITVSCLPDKIVDEIAIDVSHLDIGDSVHISELELPEGLSSSADDHLTVAVVAAPTLVAEPELEEEEEILEEALEEAEPAEEHEE